MPDSQTCSYCGGTGRRHDAMIAAVWVNGRVVASPQWNQDCPECSAPRGTACRLAGGRAADNGWVHPERKAGR